MAKDPNERDDAPKFQIIDNRLLSDEERSGKVAASSSDAPKIEIIGGTKAASSSEDSSTEPTEKPRFEILGGTRPAPQNQEETQRSAASGSGSGSGEESEAELAEGEEELSEAEMEQLASEMEAEQFAAIEAQIGRPLSEEEKGQVREEMNRQAERVSRLEVAPILLQTITELPRYAAVHLGLIANPYTRLIARNDQEARLAIDAFGALYEVVKNRVDTRASSELGRVLNDLRANYTRVTGMQIDGPGDGPRIIR